MTMEMGLSCSSNEWGHEARWVQLCTCAEGRRGRSMNHLGGVSPWFIRGGETPAARRGHAHTVCGRAVLAEDPTPTPPPPRPPRRCYRTTPSQPQGHRRRRCFCFCLQTRQTANKRPISNAIHLSAAAGWFKWSLSWGRGRWGWVGGGWLWEAEKRAAVLLCRHAFARCQLD